MSVLPGIITESLNRSHIVKQNEDEVEATANMMGKKFFTVEDYGKWMINEFNIEIVLVTLGEKGARVITEDGYRLAPGNKITVVDTVGCGDGFSAGFLIGIDKTGDPVKAARAGCKLGEIVSSNKGAVPDYDVEEVLGLI